MQKCSICWIEKDETCFYKNTNRKNWIDGRCKDCCKIKRHERYLLDKIYWPWKSPEAIRKKQEAPMRAKMLNKASQKRYYERHKWTLHHKLMAVRTSMNCRCRKENNDHFKWYWWRWIKILRDSFDSFYSDMAPLYQEHVDKYWYWRNNVQIDRINNNWHYCKENCRWVTAKQNNPKNHAKEREIRKLCFILSNINKNAL